MKLSVKLLLGIAFLAGLQSCQQKKTNKAPLDGFTSGTAQFYGDESFSPIVDEELYVFKAKYTEANPVITYKPESEVVSSLMNDKVRVVIMARELDTAE